MPPIDLSFDIARRVSLTVSGMDEDTQRVVTSQMDPYRPGVPTARDAGVRIEQAGDGERLTPSELVNPANDGLTTALTEDGHCIVVGGRACLLPEPGAPVARLVAEAGFPISKVFRRVVRPALQLACVEAGAVAIHAACVEMDGRAVAVAGWSETGKTEVALALMERGARFVSDKWTVIGPDVSAGAFPITVGVRGWVLDALPTLRAALPRMARLQLGTAGAVAAVARPVRAPVSKVRVGQMLMETVDRGVILGDRAALTPRQIAAAYGHDIDETATPPLGTVVLLATSPGGDVVVDEVDATWAARRLARSAAYERREYYELFERARFVRDDDEAMTLRSEVERREEEFLAGALQGVRLVRVRTPFPHDPRVVVAAVLGESGG